MANVDDAGTKSSFFGTRFWPARRAIFSPKVNFLTSQLLDRKSQTDLFDESTPCSKSTSLIADLKVDLLIVDLKVNSLMSQLLAESHFLDKSLPDLKVNSLISQLLDKSTPLIADVRLHGRAGRHVRVWQGQGDQILFFNCLHLHHKPPDSGERQYRSASTDQGLSLSS